MLKGGGGVESMPSADLLNFKLILIRLQYVFTLNKTPRFSGKSGQRRRVQILQKFSTFGFPTGHEGLSQDLASCTDSLSLVTQSVPAVGKERLHDKP